MASLIGTAVNVVPKIERTTWYEERMHIMVLAAGLLTDTNVIRMVIRVRSIGMRIHINFAIYIRVQNINICFRI